MPRGRKSPYVNKKIDDLKPDSSLGSGNEIIKETQSDITEFDNMEDQETLITKEKVYDPFTPNKPISTPISTPIREITTKPKEDSLDTMKKYKESLFDFKVEIRRIDNLNKSNDFSKELDQLKASHTFGALVDRTGSFYETGLTSEDITYLKEEKRVAYNLDAAYNIGEPHSFWDSTESKISLGHATTILYPYRNPLDYIKWKYLLKSKYIYVSEEEMQKGTKTEATHYMYDEYRNIEAKALLIEEKHKLLKRIADLTLERKRAIVTIINNEITENRRENYLVVAIENIVSNETKKEYLKTLLDVSTEGLFVKSTVSAAVIKNIIQKKPDGFYYFEIKLGYTQDAVEEFLIKPENQTLLTEISNKIKL